MINEQVQNISKNSTEFLIKFSINFDQISISSLKTSQKSSQNPNQNPRTSKFSSNVQLVPNIHDNCVTNPLNSHTITFFLQFAVFSLIFPLLLVICCSIWPSSFTVTYWEIFNKLQNLQHWHFSIPFFISLYMLNRQSRKLFYRNSMCCSPFISIYNLIIFIDNCLYWI